MGGNSTLVVLFYWCLVLCGMEEFMTSALSEVRIDLMEPMALFFFHARTFDEHGVLHWDILQCY